MSLQSTDFEEKFKNAMWFVEFKPKVCIKISLILTLYI